MNCNYPVFLASEIDSVPLEKAAFAILPVPYEKTVSYDGGTANGPAAILEASSQLETWDGKSNPSALGIHTCEPIDCSQNAELVLENISKSVRNIIEAGTIPVILGGEHTVTSGIIKGLLSAGVKDIGVVQIDAHADLREAYEGDTLSHASVMKRVIDLGVPVYQLGVRALCEEELETRAKFDIPFIDGEELVMQNIQSIKLPEDFPKNVFFTLDIDGMDPSVFPSTGTPVPGGLSWYQTLNIFESVAEQRNIIGFDVVEFSPIQNFHAYDFSAALLTYKLMGIVSRNS
ncbi:MAG: agmatinase [Kiritimatiellae bacterium]|nr:agmatinase [Kiritimatiellia bacterium]